MTNIIRAFGVKTSEHFILATAFVACLSTWASTASSDPPQRTNKTQYAALQSFSQDFGSKSTSGYFVSETGKCFVTLTIAKKMAPESPAGQPAERISLLLNPGQMVGLDSEEGQSMTFTCAKNASALMVNSGEKDALMASQKRANEDSTAIDWDVYRQW